MILTAKWRSCAIQAFKEDQASIGMFNKLKQILLAVCLLVQRPVSLCKHFSGNNLVATKWYSAISTQESIMTPSRPHQTRFISNSTNNLLDEVTLDPNDPFDDLLLRVLRTPKGGMNRYEMVRLATAFAYWWQNYSWFIWGCCWAQWIMGH